MKTLEVLTDFIKSQLLCIIGKELDQFLKEKEFTNIKDVAKQADYFVEAHAGTHKVVSKDKSGSQSKGSTSGEPVKTTEASKFGKKTARQGIQ